MCFIVEMLRHPTVLQELRAEQDAAWGPYEPGENHCEISAEFVQKKVPFMNKCITETERRYPPAPGNFRGANESFEYDGVRIKKGAQIFYDALTTNHDPCVSLLEPAARARDAAFSPPLSQSSERARAARNSPQVRVRGGLSGVAASPLGRQEPGGLEQKTVRTGDVWGRAAQLPGRVATPHVHYQPLRRVPAPPGTLVSELTNYP